MINAELNEVSASKAKEGDVFRNFNNHGDILFLKSIMYTSIYCIICSTIYV